MSVHPDLVKGAIAIMYSLILFAIYYLAKLTCSSSENFWHVSDASQCKGGPYFWQGDSDEAKMCRQMAKTKEGKIAISSYNCPTGYNGAPSLPFYYTPVSDDKWKNERCNNEPTCNGVDVGMCSMVKQVE
jgi:hypothetical protein